MNSPNTHTDTMPATATCTTTALDANGRQRLRTISAAPTAKQPSDVAESANQKSHSAIASTIPWAMRRRVFVRRSGSCNASRQRHTAVRPKTRHMTPRPFLPIAAPLLYAAPVQGLKARPR